MGNNILIVDDAAFMRMMVKDILTKGGYNVVGEAENGVVAVQKYAELKPDLVTLDITMPEMDGIQALKKIKEVDAGANVIMCSAMGQQAMGIEAIQNGAKDFIVKPFQADRVLEAEKKVIGKYILKFKGDVACETSPFFIKYRNTLTKQTKNDNISFVATCSAGVAELADAHDSKSCG